MRAVHDLPVDDEAPADAGSKCYHQHALKSAAAAFPLLSKRRRIRVVDGFHFNASQHAGKLLRYIDNAPAEIDAVINNSAVQNRSRHIDADSQNI